MNDQNKILHIDASRLKSGGGIIHLIKLLENIKYSTFKKIVVYTYENNRFKKYENKNIEIKTHSFINKNIFFQIIWQKFILPMCLAQNELLFTIDSTSFCDHKNTVILNQDLIGFQSNSLKNFSFTMRLQSYLKYKIAKKAILNSYSSIYTTEYARNEIFKKTGTLNNSTVIPHGINDFGLIKKKNYKLSSDKIKVIYVSPVLDYKNHTYLISALNKIKTKKKIEAYFVGGGNKKLITRLKNQLSNENKNKFYFMEFLKPLDVFDLVNKSDIAFFMSSVECFGITLLEYMRMAMPIICSSDSSLPETLASSGLLVNPKDVDGIIKLTTKFIESENLRISYGKKAYKRSLNYSWEITAKKTFNFLAESNYKYLNNLN
jgi:glycosyltransferase involved in cell wall biosynthesis